MTAHRTAYDLVTSGIASCAALDGESRRAIQRYAKLILTSNDFRSRPSRGKAREYETARTTGVLSKKQTSSPLARADLTVGVQAGGGAMPRRLG